jgi:hypothetical protein
LVRTEEHEKASPKTARLVTGGNDLFKQSSTKRLDTNDTDSSCSGKPERVSTVLASSYSSSNDLVSRIRDRMTAILDRRD